MAGGVRRDTGDVFRGLYFFIEDGSNRSHSTLTKVELQSQPLKLKRMVDQRKGIIVIPKTPRTPPRNSTCQPFLPCPFPLPRLRSSLLLPSPALFLSRACDLPSRAFPLPRLACVLPSPFLHSSLALPHANRSSLPCPFPLPRLRSSLPRLPSPSPRLRSSLALPAFFPRPSLHAFRPSLQRPILPSSLENPVHSHPVRRRAFPFIFFPSPVKSFLSNPRKPMSPSPCRQLIVSDQQ